MRFYKYRSFSLHITLMFVRFSSSLSEKLLHFLNKHWNHSKNASIMAFSCTKLFPLSFWMYSLSLIPSETSKYFTTMSFFSSNKQWTFKCMWLKVLYMSIQMLQTKIIIFHSNSNILRNLKFSV